MSQGFNGTVDWVGYPVGRTVSGNQGYRGIVDFTGIPVGTPSAIPSGGLRRLLVGVGLSLVFLLCL